MTAIEPTSRPTLNQLQVGDRIEVEHEVKVGSQSWTTRTVGVIERVERRRHGLHFRRNIDDKVYSDLLVLRLDDGQLSTLTIDEYTTLRKA